MASGPRAKFWRNDTYPFTKLLGKQLVRLQWDGLNFDNVPRGSSDDNLKCQISRSCSSEPFENQQAAHQQQRETDQKCRPTDMKEVGQDYLPSVTPFLDGAA
jgi:hypothetical protein